ncbi:MAG TPA: septum site-determining protein MinC [Burkholderiaceae bacterium]|nr:septum site-determining protein MinC [Burkholderiaceae bacterium]
MSNPAPSRKTAQALDFKSATLYAIRVVLHEADTGKLLDALAQRMKDAGAFFENEPVVVDASRLEDVIDWSSLVKALRDHSLHPVGVVAEGAQLEAAGAAGLPAVELGGAPVRPPASATPETEVPAAAVIPEKPADAAPGGNASTQASQPSPTDTSGVQREASSVPVAPTPAPAAMVINRPLRSGQRVYARNTDLIVVGVVSRGAEVIADGNIHVYGPLRGKAMAGARGDASARIFTTQLDPELVAIAGVYRVIETGLEDGLQNKAAIVRLEGESLQIEALGN